MESYLTLFVRLAVIAFIAIAVTFVITPTASKITSALTGNSAVESDDLPEPTPQPINHNLLLSIGIGVLLFVATASLLVYSRLRKFFRAIENTKRLGGRVTFTPSFSSQAFCWLHSKTTVDLSGVKISDDTITQLAALPRLEVLRVGSTDITDAKAEPISKCRYLRSLDISDTNLGDPTVQQISQLPNLETLIASDTLITDASIESLAELQELRKLECTGTSISEEGLKQLNSLRPGIHVK